MTTREMVVAYDEGDNFGLCIVAWAEMDPCLSFSLGRNSSLLPSEKLRSEAGWQSIVCIVTPCIAGVPH